MKKESALTDVLDFIVRKRSEKTLQRFQEAAISGITTSELLSALENVKSYWKDVTRPALTSFSCEAVGGRTEMADDASLIFSLAAAGISIHDDIIDKSKNKHFRKTILGAYGLDSALIVGDLLILKAWTMTNDMIKRVNQSRKMAEIIEIYGNLSLEMYEAGFMEVLCRNTLNIDLKYCQQVLWHIAAETEACARIGAVLGDGKKEKIQALGSFGRRLGFIFGIKSDVEDVLNLEGNLSNKLKHERIPLPLLFAAKSSKEKFNEINSIIRKSPISPLESRRLLELCFEAEAFEYIRTIAEQNVAEACSSLQLLEASVAREVLEFIVRKSYNEVKNLCI